MRIARALAALAVTVLAGCGTGATASHPTTPVTATSPLPANPVTVVRETGATPDAGERYGHAGVEDDQVGHGTFPGGEDVWVFTYDTSAHRDYWVAHPSSPPQDGETKILGPGISLIIVDSASLTDAGGPSPQQIASRVHGTVLP